MNKIDDALILIPNCFHTGWCESPTFFYAASETARDIIASLLQEVHPPPHTFEDKMLEPTNASAYNRLNAAASFFNLTKVFVDDFTAATNNNNRSHLTHSSRVMLHKINSILPPP